MYSSDSSQNIDSREFTAQLFLFTALIGHKLESLEDGEHTVVQI